MSNTLAIATVTTVLSELMSSAIDSAALPTTGVTSQRPGEAGWDSGGANLFLFGVEPNAALRNDDLPARRSDGSTITRPRAALNLDYLVTFFGDHLEQEPQRGLAAVVAALHARPLIGRESIQAVLTAGAYPWMAGSDLIEQLEPVRFAPLELGADELSKLWSIFPKATYALSIAYRGSVVLIDTDEDVQPVLPVARRGLRGTPFRQPFIASVEPAAGPGTPITVDSIVLLRGRGLMGDVTRLRIAGQDVVPASESELQISFVVPASLRAGVLGVHVVQLLELGEPPVPHTAIESNVASFVLRPEIFHISSLIVAGSTDTEVTVSIEPHARAGQRVSLLLNDQPGRGDAAHSVALPLLTKDVDELVFTVSGVPAGVFVARVRVDGAESPVALDPTGRWQPEVSIL